MRIFVNGRAVDVPPGSTALDAVRALDATLAAAVVEGREVITDSRGLAADPGTPLQAGAIFRLVPRRDRGAAAAAADDDESL